MAESKPEPKPVKPDPVVTEERGGKTDETKEMTETRGQNGETDETG